MSRAVVMVAVVVVLAAGIIGLVLLAGQGGRKASTAVLPDIPVVGEDRTPVDPEVRQQIDQALSALNDAPLDADANGFLGMLYELYQCPDAAEACYKRASILDDSSFRWKYYLARLDRALGRPDESITILDQAVRIQDDYVPALILLGDVQLESGHLDEAEKAYRDALKQSPRSALAMLGIGRVLAQQEKHEEAIERFSRGLEIAPQYSPLHHAAALSYRVVGKTALAQEHMDLASRTGKVLPDPDPLVAEMNRLRVGAHIDYGKAQQAYNQGRYDMAIKIAKAVVEKNPGHIVSHGLLGLSYMRTNRPRESAAAFETALKLNPTNIVFLRHYGLLMLQQGNLVKAEENFREVARLGGDHPDDHYLYGVVLAKMNRRGDAIREFEAALKGNANHTQARQALVRALEFEISQVPRDDLAVEYLRRLSELNPSDPRNWAALGVILAQQGKTAQAIVTLEKALEIQPDNPQVQAVLDELRKPGVDGNKGDH